MRDFFSKLLIDIKNTIINAGSRLIWAVIFIILFSLFIKLILRLIRKLLNRKNKSKIFKSFIINLTRYSLISIMFLILAGILGVPNTTILAVASTATLAIGLTMQGILSNIANGMLLINEKIFKDGDYVQIDEASGTVSNIGLINLQLTTFDNKIIYLPNSKVMNSIITNYDTQDKRRVDIDFKVAYESDIEKVKTIINDIIGRHNLILKDSEIIVRLVKLNDNSLTIACRVWCNRPDYFTVFYDLNESVYKALKENNIIMQNVYELKK